MKTIKKYEVRVKRVKLSERSAEYNKALTEPDEVVRVARDLLEHEDQEVFLLFPTNVRHKILGYFECHRGGFDTCPVDPRVIFRNALLVGAANIFLVHNHPSGDSRPSPEDLRLTKRLQEGATLLGMTLIDHIIIGDEGSYSFAQSGEL